MADRAVLIKDNTDGQSQCFGYDSRYRLTGAWTATDDCAAAPTTATMASSGKYPYWDSWTFDTAGRRATDTRRTPSATTGRTYTYPAAGATAVRPHAMSSVTKTGTGAGTDSFTYDNAGNMATRTVNGVQSTYTFNSDNQFAQAVVHAPGGDQTSRHLYDADGGQDRNGVGADGAAERLCVRLSLTRDVQCDVDGLDRTLSGVSITEVATLVGTRSRHGKAVGMLVTGSANCTRAALVNAMIDLGGNCELGLLQEISEPMLTSVETRNCDPSEAELRVRPADYDSQPAAPAMQVLSVRLLRDRIEITAGPAGPASRLGWCGKAVRSTSAPRCGPYDGRRVQAEGRAGRAVSRPRRAAPVGASG